MSRRDPTPTPTQDAAMLATIDLHAEREQRTAQLTTLRDEYSRTALLAITDPTRRDDVARLRREIQEQEAGLEDLAAAATALAEQRALAVDTERRERCESAMHTTVDATGELVEIAQDVDESLAHLAELLERAITAEERWQSAVRRVMRGQRTQALANYELFKQQALDLLHLLRPIPIPTTYAVRAQKARTQLLQRVSAALETPLPTE